MFSQESQFLTGKLVDASNNEPVAFASIQLKGQSIGVISNVDGSFKIPDLYSGTGDVLVVSCLGYKTVEMETSTLDPLQINIIPLTVEVMVLDNVTLQYEKAKKLSARKIVKKAIESIPKNYATDPFSLIGYYREYQYDDGAYVNLSEAILEVFDKGFDHNDKLTTKVSIYDRKLNSDFRIDTLARRPYDYRTGEKIINKAFLQAYGGNEFVILRVHDPIRNYTINSFDFVNELRRDFVKNHRFKKLGDILLNDEPIHVISLKNDHPDHSVKGTLYISKYDFAIHKVEYAVYDKRIEKEPFKHQEVKIKNNLVFETITEYRKIGEKMYLNYASFQNAFDLKMPPVFRVEEVSLNLKQKRITVTLNKKPDLVSALKPNAYDLRLKKKRLKIRSIKVEGRFVRIYPEIDKAMMLATVNSLKNDQVENTNDTKAIQVEIKNIRSIDGDVLDERQIKRYYQFREFFAHKVNATVAFPAEGPFMNDKQPIFGKQDLAKPIGKFEIWMNTPLKALEAPK
ncbi:carboxypeptidase-like regulatory domain-containing protein [Sungkyunkwania multivorans]|uniref:Carboxypeptidase-like regulatory domain-containing protein n=1 Tax=Sungkyunkwania multivorans TaxID=1173618 RepID=A0ABW3D1R3_9FLAO